MKPVFIGVAGGTGAGKSALCTALMDKYPDKIGLIQLDDYFRPSAEVPKFKRHTNWHHVYPTSRFKIKKGPALHTAWHDVFENLTPEEAMGKAAG